MTSYGLLHLSPSEIWFETTCDLRSGPRLQARVQASITMYDSYFHIHFNDYDEARYGNIVCQAHLTAGPVEYRFDYSGRMTLFNRQTGWRLELTR
jgi:hypothetical protein